MAIDFERLTKLGQLLLDCACSWLRQTSHGCPDRRGLVPGDTVAYENCCEGGGQLTVNLLTVFPSDVYPTPATAATNCNANYEVAVFSIVSLRCSPVGDHNQSPSPAALSDAAARTWSDIMAIRNGVRCCLEDEDLVRQILGSSAYRWGFGDHLTVGPEGGCAGANLQVTIGLPTCWECP